MIAFVRGRLAGQGMDYVVVDVGGVGYAVYVTQRYLAEAPMPGTEVTLQTVLVHREDAMLLYGFPTIDQRELFTMLTSVSGVGNKIALSLLGAFSTADLVSAVLTNTPKRLAQAPGVGIKTAQRLIIELKEKLARWRDVLPSRPELDTGIEVDDARLDAELALQALGYGSDEVGAALATIIESGVPAEVLIRRALEWLTLVGR